MPVRSGVGNGGKKKKSIKITKPQALSTNQNSTQKSTPLKIRSLIMNEKIKAILRHLFISNKKSHLLRQKTPNLHIRFQSFHSI